MEKINPQFYTFDEFLQGRLFEIPEYQRAYSWTSKQRKDLFNDIKKLYSYPDYDEGTRNHFLATVVCCNKNRKEKYGIIKPEDAIEYFREITKQTPGKVLAISKWLLDVARELSEIYSNLRLTAVTDKIHARLVVVAIKLYEYFDERTKEFSCSSGKKLRLEYLTFIKRILEQK